MADQFYKTMKRKENEAVTKRIEKEAVKILSQHVSLASPEEFFNKFVNHLDTSIPGQLKSAVGSDSGGGSPNHKQDIKLDIKQDDYQSRQPIPLNPSRT